MFRILFYFLIFYLVYIFFKKFKKNKSPKILEKEKMVKCEKCGIYLPETSAISFKGKFFCSKECFNEYYEKN